MLLSVAQLLSVVVPSGQFLRSRFQGAFLPSSGGYKVLQQQRSEMTQSSIPYNQQLITITSGVLYKCNMENNNNYNDK